MYIEWICVAEDLEGGGEGQRAGMRFVVGAQKILRKAILKSSKAAVWIVIVFLNAGNIYMYKYNIGKKLRRVIAMEHLYKW